MRFLASVATFFILNTIAFGNKKNNSLFLQKLSDTNTKYIVVSSPKPSLYIDSLGFPFKTYYQTLIKEKKEVYLIMEGTGRVYEMYKYNSDSIGFKRIDSTVYFGYNFKSICFSYKNKLYSFGGMGLWRRNGQLREFNSLKKEWDIIPINKEIPALNNVYFFDPKQGYLYYIADSFIDEVTNNKVFLDLLVRLDLNKYQNTIIGTPDKTLLNKMNLGSFRCYPFVSLNGSIITDQNTYFKFLDFSSNVLYDITDKRVINALQNTSFSTIDYFFTVDSTLFFPKSYSSELDSILLSKSLYKYDSKKKIAFENVDYFLSRNKILVIGIISVFFVAIFLMLYQKQYISLRKKNKPIKFDELEEILIEKLKKNKKQGISIHEMNEFLGLQNKPLSIQKKNRNDLIAKINYKYRNKTNSNADLIIRKRDEYDRRSYIYFISETA